MSYQKIPSERYENLGGINENASKYLTGLMEFLNLVNFDFSTPGALTKRPGSTQYAASGTSGTINAMEELRRLNGASKVVFSTPTGIFGLQLGSTPLPLTPTFIASRPADMEMFVDWLWIAGGIGLGEAGAVKYDGATLFAMGLPTPGKDLGLLGASVHGQSTGYFLATEYVFGFVNSRGYRGPVGVNRSVNQVSVGGVSSITIVFGPGDRLGSTAYTRAQMTGIFGATAIAVYRREASTFAGLQGLPFYRLMEIPIGASHFTDTLGGVSLGAIDRAGPNPVFVLESEVRKSNTWVADLADPSGSGGSYIVGSTLPRLAPGMMEIHQNSMFYAGYTLAPSNIYFSAIGDPETVEPDYNFEVRTNDGDTVRGMKSFGSQLLVFKENSFHKVVGDNPDNYELVEISAEYGGLNNKCAVVFRGRCFFLDPKGIVAYDGSAPRIVSKRMEATFRRMNLAAARNTACAAHYDFRNQVWFSIPVDGSTTNNLIVVYDYEADAWTKYEGIQAAALLRAEAGLNTKTILFGNYSGMVHYMGPSFLSDNGTAFTLIAQPGFMQPQGRSVEALFRRLWMDVEPLTGGQTGLINVQLLSDMSNTGITTMSVYQNAFQSRLDFGIQAKAIGFIFSHRSASFGCQINGWAVAHRWLRAL